VSWSEWPDRGAVEALVVIAHPVPRPRTRTGAIPSGYWSAPCAQVYAPMGEFVQSLPSRAGPREVREIGRRQSPGAEPVQTGESPGVGGARMGRS
jgi:hypothetical protein